MSIFDVVDAKYSYNGDNYDIKVKKWMSVNDKINFVRNVTNAVVADDGYDYMLQDMMCNYFIVQYLTENAIVIPEGIDNHLDYIEDFLFYSDIVDIVFDIIGDDIVDYYKNAVAYNIEYKTGVRIDSLRNEAALFVRSLNNFNNDVDVDKMTALANSLSDASGSITAESIVDAYMRNEGAFSSVYAQEANEGK